MNKYKLIGVGIKYGCNIEGADKGIEILQEYFNFDHIINIPTFEEPIISNMKNIEKVTAVCNELAEVVFKTKKDGFIPITIGGDHSLAMGSIAGSSKDDDLALLWIDTHTDINTHLTTLTGNIHGFPVACSIGLGPKELTNIYYEGNKIAKEKVILFGVNDIDDEETKIIEENKINTFKLDQIRKEGLTNSLEQLKNNLEDHKIHLSFDLDCMSPSDYPAVSVPNRFNQGFSIEEIYEILDFVLKFNIVSIDIVEFNPYNDKDNYCLNVLLDIINKIRSN